MRVLFLQRDPVCQMGILMMSAVVRKSGHQSVLLIECLERDFDGAVRDLNPDIIAFSATTGYHNWVCRTARRLKTFSRALIILGGWHATFAPYIIENEGIDIVCRGEGEYPLAELLGRLSTNTRIEDIKNLWIKKDGMIFKNDMRPLIRNLDSLPFMDRSLYDKYRYLKLYYEHQIFFMTGRGCPFTCNYCYNSSLSVLYPQGGYVRRRSVENVIAELSEIKQRYRVRGFLFVDDIFSIDEDWIGHFCEAYRRTINLHFTCNGHFDFLNKKILSNLKKAGCLTIKVGLEAGSDRIRQSIINRNISNEKIYEVCRCIKEEKINLLLYNVMGFPGATLEEELETLRMNITINPAFSLCYMLIPYSGTTITEFAKKNGYLEGKYIFDNVDEDDFAFSESPFRLQDKREVTNLHKFFMIVVRFPFLLPLVKLLIRFPSNRLYYTIARMYHSVVICRADKYSLADCLYFVLKTKLFRKKRIAYENSVN